MLTAFTHMYVESTFLHHTSNFIFNKAKNSLKTKFSAKIDTSEILIRVNFQPRIKLNYTYEHILIIQLCYINSRINFHNNFYMNLTLMFEIRNEHNSLLSIVTKISKPKVQVAFLVPLPLP